MQKNSRMKLALKYLAKYFQLTQDTRRRCVP